MAKSVMKHQFSQVPKAEIQRSSFDRSSGLKTTLDAGWLVPIFVDEALPGDTFNLKTTAFARLATPLHPAMDNMFMETFYFFVPMRLLWINWEKFNGAQHSPGDSTDFTIPTMTSLAGGYANQSLQDYLGLPTLIEGVTHSAMFTRSYNLIYNDWFRDENLIGKITVDGDDGPDTVGNYVLRRRGKRHDYMTSCLPWPQKGDSIDLPLGISAPVVAVTGIVPTINADDLANSKLRMTGGAQSVLATGSPTSSGDITWGNATGLETDLTSATAATINDLRQSFQVQRLLERDARGGTRYTEIVRAHFGVTSPDARLQRPEYLGGGSSSVNITQVPQTSETDVNTPQGNLAAYGTTTLNNHGFNKSFTEHGIIIGLINVRADLTYQQGLPRMFSRSTRYDFYWPALSHIGEQTVLNQEIFTQGVGDPTADADVFGYQERYAEYRYRASQITGKFRSNDAVSLDTWHLSEDFPSLPALNETFINSDPPIDRIIAVQTEPHFILDCHHSLRCARPMPVYGVPGWIDHF